ncbi:hypothetical protein B0H11DRAFT_1663868, partial [Mycena galericulata]
IVCSLEGMTKRFAHPYVVYYPLKSREGLPFSINENIRGIQGSRFQSHLAWKGDIIVGKCMDQSEPFSSMTSVSMADFPILKNFLGSLGSPQ